MNKDAAPRRNDMIRVADGWAHHDDSVFAVSRDGCMTELAVWMVQRSRRRSFFLTENAALRFEKGQHDSER